MKSIMHEASSLVKAIEQGWVKAGKPQEFRITILEEPQKNFLGFTTRNAKIALFFDEKISKEPSKQQRPHRQQYHERSQPTQASRFEIEKKQQKEKRKEEKEESPRQEKFQRQPLWNDAMVQTARTWLTTTLELLGKEKISFSLEPQRWYLRITLAQPLQENSAKEKQLLASLATLLLETLKRSYKTGLRGHKVVITHASTATD